MHITVKVTITKINESVGEKYKYLFNQITNNQFNLYNANCGTCMIYNETTFQQRSNEVDVSNEKAHTVWSAIKSSDRTKMKQFN